MAARMRQTQDPRNLGHISKRGLKAGMYFLPHDETHCTYGCLQASELEAVAGEGGWLSRES